MAERKKKKYSNCTYTTGNLSLNLNQFNKDAIIPDEDTKTKPEVVIPSPDENAIPSFSSLDSGAGEAASSGGEGMAEQLETKENEVEAPVVDETNKQVDENIKHNLDEKRETKRYYIRPQNIFCANKKDVIKALIDVAEAGENCSIYTLKNLDDHDDVHQLSNNDIIYTYDNNALRDKNGVLVMDYDLFIKHEEERPNLGKSPDKITKAEFDQNYDDRMTQNTFVEAKEDNNMTEDNLIGKKVTIVALDPNDPAADEYAGKEGTIEEVGQDPYGDTFYRGTWGGIALYPKVDKLKITEGVEKNVSNEDPFDLTFEDYESDRKLFESGDEPQICCICGEEYTGYGNNAEPYKHGYCCDECNLKFVIPARMQGLDSYYNKDEKNK